MDWSRLPDVGAVGLLTCAFVSVAKRAQSSESSVWLIGWLMIVLHFFAQIFQNLNGPVGNGAAFASVCALAWGGLLFTWAAVPYRNRSSSRWMLGVMAGNYTLYLAVLYFASSATWALTLVAVLFGALPLAIALISMRNSSFSQRWLIVLLNCALSAFLLVFQNRPGNGPSLALNAVFCAVYLGACIHFCHAYWRATTGAFISISGFFAWSMVFVVGPLTLAYLPNLKLESEVWNLPKYLVAVGMILLLLEDQIEHNKYLALHDELTGLPNRRLFQDRLTSALERARRLGTQAALLLVDLDHFKDVNDTFGHHTGDLVLARVGAVLNGRVRRSDTVARTGGDEFSIVLEEPTTREDAERVCNSLMQLLASPINIEEHTVSVGASVGFAIFPDDAATSESLCIAADLRMYSEKYVSRNIAESSAQTAENCGDRNENGRTTLAASK